MFLLTDIITGFTARRMAISNLLHGTMQWAFSSFMGGNDAL